MKLSEIHQLVNQEITPTEFLESNTSDLKEFEKRLKKRGSIVPIRVDEDIEYVFKSENLGFLCKSFLSKSLSPIAISYIVDVLTLSDFVEFEDEVADQIVLLTDPEINGELTEETVTEILEGIAK